MPKPADPHLERLHDLAEEALAGYEALLATYTPAQLAWKPSAEAWSMADCAEHVRKTDRLYTKRLLPAVDEARSGGLQADRGFRARWFIRTLFYPFIAPEVKRTTKTFPVVEPSVQGDPEAAVAAIEAMVQHQRETFVPLLGASDGLDLRKVRVASPFARMLKFQLGEALEVLTLHQHRHLNQAKRVAEAPGFPEA